MQNAKTDLFIFAGYLRKALKIIQKFAIFFDWIMQIDILLNKLQ